MQLWHMTPDATRRPLRVAPGNAVVLEAGTWPIAQGQSVWATYATLSDGVSERRVARGRWVRNDAKNSYWEIELGRFRRGDQVTYTVLGESEPGVVVACPPRSFKVGPKLQLALLWHQHQPMYADPEHPGAQGSLRQPWVRLHALRDYYAMAALVSRFPNVHLTINLTPSLLRQLSLYLEAGVTDRALELTLEPAELLTDSEREEIAGGFFEASWHHQILPHPRYAELFRLRADGASLGVQEIRDLQMWFSLAWFHPEFLDGDVELPTGEVVRVASFAEQGRGFSHAQIQQMVAEQYKLLAAVVPIHRMLQDRGQVEITTSPLYHPILPLLIDTDHATLDRPGTRLPRRFAHPEDAAAQIGEAVADYTRAFGRPPRGLWPPEGAVSSESIPLIAAHGIRWIASDQGVLERSGKWGYRAGDPDVLCQPYRLEAAGASLAIFFRDHALSDLIGFGLQYVPDPEQAAHMLLSAVRERVLRRLASDQDRVVSIILDGENPWGSFARAGQPFLEALYRLLQKDPELETVSFGEYLEGNPARMLDAHPLEAQTRLFDLYTGSWVDELGSKSGVDLGTWIGEEEENVAWELLGDARDALERSGASVETQREAFEAIWIAEGSDWFWWFGSDQDSGRDDEFDALFRARLRQVWRALGLEPPRELDQRFVRTALVWSFAQQPARALVGDRLVVRTNCPGIVTFRVDDRESSSAELVPIGGVMAGPKRHQYVIGPIPERARTLSFSFRCTNLDCDHRHAACRGGEQRVRIESPDYELVALARRLVSVAARESIKPSSA